MLDSFRENARSWLIQFIIAAISLVFIFSFGMGSRGFRSGGGETIPTWSAKVNGNVVPVMAFDGAYRNQVQMLQYYGIKPEDFQKYSVRENVMKSLISEELLAQEAEKNGIYVSDDELAKDIEKQFTTDGKFDADYYRQYLQRDKGLEERTRRALMAQHMRALVQNSVTVSEDEIQAAYLKQEEGASIAYVRFTPAQFATKVQVTDADVDKALADRKADIQKKYDENPTFYMDPHAIKAQRIYVAVKQNATKDEEDAAKKKIDDAMAQLKAGKSWDEVAGQFKDAAAGQQTDLGWVAQGQSTLDRTTEDNVFKLKPGQRSEVIRAPFGYEIIQAQEDRPAVQKKLEAVQRDIARDLARETKLKELAKAAAEETLTKLKAGQPLEQQWPARTGEDATKLGPSMNPEAKITDEFHPNGGVIPNLGSVPKVSAAAFALTADKRIPDGVIEDQNAFFVIELKSRKRADLSKLTGDKKDELRKQVQDEKKNQILEAWLKNLRDKAKVEENPALLSYGRRRGSGEPVDEG